MGFGHLVLYKVFTYLDSQLGEADIIKVYLRSLETMDIGMTWGLVTMPGIVRPGSSS